MISGLETPDFLVIGHVCRDVVAEPPGFRVGGTVFYAASTAVCLGRTVGVVTAGGPEVEALRELPGCSVVSLDAGRSTSFENIYGPFGRRQYLRNLAPAIPLELVPPEWTRTRVTLIAPVAGEVPIAVFRMFGRSLVGVTPQGYMRQWGADRQVHYRPWTHATDVLPHVAAAIFSEDDLQGHTVDWVLQPGPVFVITKGERGCELIYRGKRRHVPGFPQPAPDRTGAGDVFAAAFLLRLADVKDPLRAARFANCVASFFVGADGISGLPTMEQVEQRLAEDESNSSV